VRGEQAGALHVGGDVRRKPAEARKVMTIDFRPRDDEKKEWPFIINEQTNRPYLADNFRHVFREVCEAAQARHPRLPLAKIRFMWLRHTRMAEAVCELPEIAAITSHMLASVVDIIEHYLVRTGKMARSAFKKRSEHLDAQGYRL
jgi:hypothetical protein